MRVIGAVVFWLAATVALAVAVPAAWAQRNIVDEDVLGSVLGNRSGVRGTLCGDGHRRRV